MRAKKYIVSSWESTYHKKQNHSIQNVFSSIFIIHILWMKMYWKTCVFLYRKHLLPALWSELWWHSPFRPWSSVWGMPELLLSLADQASDRLSGQLWKNEQIVNLSNPEKPHLYVKKNCEIVSLELEHKREITCIIWHGCLVRVSTFLFKLHISKQKHCRHHS